MPLIDTFSELQANVATDVHWPTALASASAEGVSCRATTQMVQSAIKPVGMVAR